MNRLWIALMVGGLAMATLTAAQLRVDVQLVNVVATVTDERGRHVSGLTADDFIVKEDGQVQKINRLSQSTDLPVSVGVVLDSSGSMERKMATATDAVDRFIRSIHEDDDIFLMTFATRPALAQSFTHDRNRLTAALRRLSIGGETALYDALSESLKELRSGLHVKKAILLITDGQDTASRLTYGEVLQAVRESEMLVYAMGISASDSGTLPGTSGPSRIPSANPPIILTEPVGRRAPTINIPVPTIPGQGPTVPGIPGGPQVPGGRGTPFPGRLPLASASQRQRLPGGTVITISDSVDMGPLDGFAEESGGRSWLLSPSWMDRRGNEINNALEEIAAELRNQYSIDYYPAHPIKDGKWHRIEVSTKNPDYHVRARKEYFGR